VLVTDGSKGAAAAGVLLEVPRRRVVEAQHHIVAVDFIAKLRKESHVCEAVRLSSRKVT
jgi:hypothetical protein